MISPGVRVLSTVCLPWGQDVAYVRALVPNVVGEGTAGVTVEAHGTASVDDAVKLANAIMRAALAVRHETKKESSCHP